MVQYDKKRNLLTITDIVSHSDLLNFDDSIWLRDIVFFNKKENRICINSDILITENSELILSNGRFKLLGSSLSLHNNASLTIGDDIPYNSTNVDFNNCNLFTSENNCLNIKNSSIISNKPWDVNFSKLFSVVNSRLNFKIYNANILNPILRNITLIDNGGLIFDCNELVYHNLTSESELDFLLHIRPNNKNIYLYNPNIKNYTYLANNSNDEEINLYIKTGNEDYNIDVKNDFNYNAINVNVIHEVIVSGKFLTINNSEINNQFTGNLDIINRQNTTNKLEVINGVFNQYVTYYNKEILFPIKLGDTMYLTDINNINNLVLIDLSSMTTIEDDKVITNINNVDNTNIIILIERMIREVMVEQNNNYKDIINILHHMVETSGKPIKVTPPLVIKSPGGTKITI